MCVCVQACGEMTLWRHQLEFSFIPVEFYGAISAGAMRWIDY